MKWLIPLLLLANTAVADVATAVAIRGDVYANDVKISQGSALKVHDHIITNDKSFVVLQFVDGARVTVRPDSHFVIEEYSYLEGDDRGRFDLVSGGLRIVTGAIAKTDPDNYTLSTPVALMGVRGTEFSIQLMED